MKLLNKCLLVLMLPIILGAETPWHTVSFGISENSNSATFHLDKFFIGIDAHRMSFDGNVWTNEWTYFDPYYYINPDTQEEVYVAPTSEWILRSAGISIETWSLIPRFGKRFNLKNKEKIQSFADIEGYIGIPLLEININTRNDGDTEDSEDEFTKSDIEEFEDIIDDLLDFTGFKVSYGITYEINKQLSLSTSFGYHHYFRNFDYKIKSDDQQKRSSISLDISEGYTFTAFAINFTF